YPVPDGIRVLQHVTHDLRHLSDGIQFHQRATNGVSVAIDCDCVQCKHCISYAAMTQDPINKPSAKRRQSSSVPLQQTPSPSYSSHPSPSLQQTIAPLSSLQKAR